MTPINAPCLWTILLNNKLKQRWTCVVLLWCTVAFVRHNVIFISVPEQESSQHARLAHKRRSRSAENLLSDSKSLNKSRHNSENDLRKPKKKASGTSVALEVSVLHWRWVFFRIRSKVSWSWRFMADGTELFACDEKHALFFCKTSSGCFCLIYEHCSDSAESKHQQFCDNVC